jgi:peptide/nickel transport system permease protein
MVEKLRVQLGLDKPWYVQYWIWCGQVLRGDLGKSIKSRRPVLEEIGSKFPHTVELVFFSFCLAIPFGVSLGVLAAAKPHSVFDYLATALSVIGVSMPAFWLALMVLLLFSGHLGWFPTFGLLSARISLETKTHFYFLDALLSGNLTALGSFLHHMILPSMVLATVPLAYITRMVKSSMLDVMKEDYISTARAKGLVESTVLLKHALRNALIPVTITIGTISGLLLGGAVLTETIFSLPGMGRLIVTSILERDFPLIQGCILLFAVSYNLLTLLTDVVCQFIDPRAHYG